MTQALNTKRVMEDLWSLEDLLYEDLQQKMYPKRQRRCCQGAEGCTKSPIYGIERRQPTHCIEHKELSMVNVVSRNCQHPSLCFTQASFGHPNEKPLFCKTHKEDGMINVISRRCEHISCLMMPSFGFDRGHALRCSAHKLPGMWNVSASTCKYPGCTVFASYGYTGKKSLRCTTHRLPDMLHTKLINNLEALSKQYKAAAERELSIQQPAAKHQPKYDICVYCTTRASYGNYATKRQFCKAHMNPKLHWKVTFCDKGGCENVAEPGQSWEGLNLCLDHLSNVVHIPTAVAVNGHGILVEANPLEVEMQQALLQ